MKTLRILFIVLVGGLLIVEQPLRAQTLKEKLAAKLKTKKGDKESKGGKERSYDFEDPSGISGMYYLSHTLTKGEKTVGFEFTKEKDDKIVNELRVQMSGKVYSMGNRPYTMTFKLQERYQKKYNLNYFTLTDKDIEKLLGEGMYNNRDEWSYLSLTDHVYAFAKNDEVVSVAAKDKAALEEYDLETAQVLFEQNISKIRMEAMDKETAKWMKNELYKKYVGKIMFSNSFDNLTKRGYITSPPDVKEEGFFPTLDMGENMLYTAYFKYPPAEQFPGKEINIVYEMNGKIASRTALREESSTWYNIVPRIETSKFKYRKLTPRSLREQVPGKGFIQDNAFMKVLYDQKEIFKVGSENKLTVKIYMSVDGEDRDLLAEGVVTLKYTEKAKKEFEKSDYGAWSIFETKMETGE